MNRLSQEECFQEILQRFTSRNEDIIKNVTCPPKGQKLLLDQKHNNYGVDESHYGCKKISTKLDYFLSG